MTLTWDHTYETGNERIDSQHLKLFELTNCLERMLQGKEVLDPGPVMEYLETYVNIHFCYEELCMSMARCTMHEVNRDAHKKFLELFAEMQKRYAAEGPTRTLTEELHETIEGWIVKHICKIDVSLRSTAQRA